MAMLNNQMVRNLLLSNSKKCSKLQKTGCDFAADIVFPNDFVSHIS